MKKPKKPFAKILLYCCFIFSLCLLPITASHAASIYVSGSTGDIYQVDTATGLAAFVTDTPIMSDIAFDAAGQLWGINYSYPPSPNLYTIDISISSNAAGLIGSTGITGANALTFGQDGTLYSAGVSTTFRYLYSLNTTTGYGTPIWSGGTMTRISAGDLEFDPDGNLYLAADTGTNDELVLLNEQTGAGRLIGQTGFDYLHGLAFADGIMYGFSGRKILTLDLATGTATKIGDITFEPGILGFSSVYGAAASPVPLPAPIILLGSGLAGLLFGRRRFKGTF